MTKGKLGALVILFIFVSCLFVGQEQKQFRYININCVIETQKWANNKRAGDVAVIPCYWLLHVGKKEKA